MQKIAQIIPETLKQRLTTGAEIALLDVREYGEYGEGHPIFAVNLPYSRLEAKAAQLLPCRSAPCVLLDNGDGVAEKAARRLGDLGHSNLAILDGGAPAWQAAGFTLYQGVNPCMASRRVHALPRRERALQGVWRIGGAAV